MSNEEENQSPTVFDVISKSLHRSLPDSLSQDVEGHLDTVYGCAVAHALRDLEHISGKGCFGEEDRTASLIGHLGSHLGWYLAMWDLSGNKAEQPSVSWSYQSKKAEAGLGGDFGLAVRLQDNQYNIAFFQAKNADLSPNGSVQIGRKPYGYNKATKKISQEQAQKNALAADRELKEAIHGGVLSATNGTGQHQFTKLALLADRAKKMTGFESDWIHYVLWPENESTMPIFCNLPTMKVHLQNYLKALGTEETMPLKLPSAVFDDTCTFASLLMRGNHSQSQGWLSVNKEEAKNLIGNLTELCNSWMIVEDRESSGGLAHALTSLGVEFFEQHPPLHEVPPLQIQTTPAQSAKANLGI